MNKKGFMLIESLLLFLIVTMSIQYTYIYVSSLDNLNIDLTSKDNLYEEAYK